MKTIKSLFFLFALGLVITSCGKEECKTCTAEQVVTQDGMEVATQSISGVEYCGEALEAVDGQVITTEQTVGDLTQSSVTTYTCI